MIIDMETERRCYDEIQSEKDGLIKVALKSIMSKKSIRKRDDKRIQRRSNVK